MPTAATFKDHFSRQSGDYSRYRPGYPPDLIAWVASRAPDRALAVDCATGNGQAAIALAGHFDAVLAVDGSLVQLGRALPHPKVRYELAMAEHLPVPDQSVSLLAAAQAVQVIAASTQVYSLTYQLNLTPQQNWRQTHFGTTANSGNAADTFDYDGDGFTNAAEYTAGTNPTMSGDFFKAENPQRSGSTFSVSTAGKAGRSYVLERSATMAAGSWTPLGTPQGPLPADAPVTLTDAASPLGAAFYHIVVTGP